MATHKPRSTTPRTIAANEADMAALIPRVTRVSELANIALTYWDNPSYSAVPYLKAMLHLDSVADYYGVDDGRGIVTYFLSNAATWTGPVARAVKAQLTRMLRQPISSMD